MADDTPDPIASTAAFRAFSAGGRKADGSGGADPATDGFAGDEPARRRPSPLVFVTAILLLVALAAGILAFAL